MKEGGFLGQSREVRRALLPYSFHAREVNRRPSGVTMSDRETASMDNRIVLRISRSSFLTVDEKKACIMNWSLCRVRGVDGRGSMISRIVVSLLRLDKNDERWLNHVEVVHTSALFH